MADLFKTAGADRLICVDLHTAQIQGFFDGPVDHLQALPILSRLRARTSTATSSSPSSPRTPAGSRSPSSGASAWTARRWPSSTRPATSTAPTSRVANRVVGDGRGLHLHPRRRHDRLRRHHLQGRRRADGRRRGRASSSRRPTRSSPTPATSGSRTRWPARSSSPTRCRSRRRSCFDKLTVLSIAPLISQAIHEVFEDGSVTSLFDTPA